MNEFIIPRITITWGLKKQTLKECSETLIIFLERLKRLDSRFDRWYEGAKTKEKALQKKVILDYEYIKNRFCKDCNDSDYPELSYNLSFWSGNEIDTHAYKIIVSIGQNQVGNNMIMLVFPYEGELYDYYKDKENWNKLLELFIDHWQPDQYRDFNNLLISL